VNKKAKPIAIMLRKEVPRPKGEWHLCPVFDPPSRSTIPAPQIGEVLMFDWTYTPLDLHPLYDTQSPNPDDPRVGMGDFYAHLAAKHKLKRSKADKAMKAFNDWWDKQRDVGLAVKAIWG